MIRKLPFYTCFVCGIGFNLSSEARIRLFYSSLFDWILNQRLRVLPELPADGYLWPFEPSEKLYYYSQIDIRRLYQPLNQPNIKTHIYLPFINL